MNSQKWIEYLSNKDSYANQNHKLSQYYKGTTWDTGTPKPMPIDDAPDGVDIRIRDIYPGTMPRSEDSGTPRGEYYEFLEKIRLYEKLCELQGYKVFYRSDEEGDTWTVTPDMEWGRKVGWLVMRSFELYHKSKSKKDAISWLRKNVPPLREYGDPWSHMRDLDFGNGIYLGDGVYV